MTTNTYILCTSQGFDSFERESIAKRLDHILGMVDDLSLNEQARNQHGIEATFGFNGQAPANFPLASSDWHRVVTIERRPARDDRPSRIILTCYSQETQFELRLARPVRDDDWTEMSLAKFTQEIAYWRSLLDRIVPPNNSPMRDAMDREIANGLTATFALLYAKGYDHSECTDGVFDIHLAHPHEQTSVTFRTAEQHDAGDEPAPCFNDAGSELLATLFPSVLRMNYGRTQGDIYLSLTPYLMPEEFMDLPFDNPIEMMRIIGSLPADKIDGIVLPPNLSV